MRDVSQRRRNISIDSPIFDKLNDFVKQHKMTKLAGVDLVVKSGLNALSGIPSMIDKIADEVLASRDWKDRKTHYTNINSTH